MMTKQFTESEKELRKAMDGAIEEWGTIDSKTAQLIGTLALLLQYQRKYSEAESLYKQQLSIWKELLGKDSIQEALVFHNLGMMRHVSEVVLFLIEGTKQKRRSSRSRPKGDEDVGG